MIQEFQLLPRSIERLWRPPDLPVELRSCDLKSKHSSEFLEQPSEQFTIPQAFAAGAAGAEENKAFHKEAVVLGVKYHLLHSL